MEERAEISRPQQSQNRRKAKTPEESALEQASLTHPVEKRDLARIIHEAAASRKIPGKKSKYANDWGVEIT